MKPLWFSSLVLMPFKMMLVIKLHVNNHLWAEELASIPWSSQNGSLIRFWFSG